MQLLSPAIVITVASNNSVAAAIALAAATATVLPAQWLWRGVSAATFASRCGARLTISLNDNV